MYNRGTKIGKNFVLVVFKVIKSRVLDKTLGKVGVKMVKKY